MLSCQRYHEAYNNVIKKPTQYTLSTPIGDHCTSAYNKACKHNVPMLKVHAGWSQVSEWSLHHLHKHPPWIPLSAASRYSDSNILLVHIHNSQYEETTCGSSPHTSHCSLPQLKNLIPAGIILTIKKTKS